MPTRVVIRGQGSAPENNADKNMFDTIVTTKNVGYYTLPPSWQVR